MPALETSAVAAPEAAAEVKTETTVKAGGKKSAKKAATKKSAKKGAKAAKAAPEKKAAPKKASDGTSANFKDAPWSETKVKVFKAVKNGKDMSVEKIVAKTGLTEQQVKHILYHGRPEAGNLFQDVKYEGDATRYFTLTKKGEGVDPDAELKKAKGKE